MATRRYSINPDAGANTITEAVGAATATKPIELTFDLANVTQGNTKPITRGQLLRALNEFRDYILRDTFPPA